MDASRLTMFFSGAIDPATFSREIAVEVDEFERALHIRGSSAPINLFGDASSIVVGTGGIIRLCDACIHNELSLVHVQYICDALDLADVQIPDPSVREAVDELANAEDALISKDTLIQVRARMAGMAGEVT